MLPSKSESAWSLLHDDVSIISCVYLWIACITISEDPDGEGGKLGLCNLLLEFAAFFAASPWYCYGETVLTACLVCVCVYVCLFVWQREREWERERGLHLYLCGIGMERTDSLYITWVKVCDMLMCFCLSMSSMHSVICLCLSVCLCLYVPVFYYMSVQMKLESLWSDSSDEISDHA